MNKTEQKVEYIANGIMMAVQANRYGAVIYNTERNDFNHGHLKMAARRGYQEAEKDYALTWEDMETIEDVIREVRNEFWGADRKHSSQVKEEMYKEVFSRFNEERNERIISR